MMQSELLLPSWPTLNFSTWRNLDYNILQPQENMNLSSILDYDLLPSPNESSLVSSNSYNSPINPITLHNEFLDLESFMNDSTPIIEESLPSGDIDEIFQWINGNYTEQNQSSPMEGDDWSPCVSLESTQNSMHQVTLDVPLAFPSEKLGVNEELRFSHLLKAYGEAIENGEKDLAEVIVKSINEKTCPMGNTMERVAYNLFQSCEYLIQESSKNMFEAFKVVYANMFSGKFAHFSANSAILESIPFDIETVHVIDFDVGEGIQWPPILESLSKKHKGLRITCTKLEDELTSSYWDFRSTKGRIQDHARQYGINVQIEEKSIENIVNELMRMKKRRKNGQFLVFNCMAGLPHMGRRRSRNSVNEFLKYAKETLAFLRGVVILGDGEPTESLNFSSYFDEQLRHYQAMFQSLEKNFPIHLAEARMALESLFLAPLMNQVGWFHDWEKIFNGGNRANIAMDGRKFSHESLKEARCLVNEVENLYSVQIEGSKENEMVLRWKKTPLVRVSSWM